MCDGFRAHASVRLAVTPSPAPATSNVACGFPALRSPACFAPRVMGPDHARDAFDAGSRLTWYSLKSPRLAYSHCLLHLLQPKSAFALAYILRLRSCRLMGVLVTAPLPSLLPKKSQAAGPLRSAAVTPLHRYYEPVRHRLVFGRLPGVSGYTANLLRRFLVGTRTASPVASRVLVIVLPLPPRRSATPHRLGFVAACCLRSTAESSASGFYRVEATCGFTCVAAR